MPVAKKTVRQITTQSTTLVAVLNSGRTGGCRFYVSGTYIPAEVYYDQNGTIVADQPIHALSLANAGQSSIYASPGLYRAVAFPVGNSIGPVGLAFEDNIYLS